jgi:hypothetical protein
MGYDIVTVQADKAKAEAFAKKYEYFYLFNKDTGEFDGDATVYFRSNIWGMSTIRNTMHYLFYTIDVTGNDYETFMSAISWNNGDIVSKDMLDSILAKLEKAKGNMSLEDYMRPLVGYSVRESWDDERDGQVSSYDGKTVTTKPYTVEEKIDDSLPLVMEWLDYLYISRDLDGFQVW